MARYGYARVSTIDQDLRLQRATLKAAGCDVIRAEKASGSRRDGRTELQVLLDFVQPGDTLIVTRIDRLARSMKDLQDIVHELKTRGVALRATEQPDRYRHRGGQSVSRHARRVRRIRNQSAARAPAGGHRGRQGPRGLQGSQAAD